MSSPSEGGLPRSPLFDVVARVREPTLQALIVAHRGDSQNAPENTLAAFAQAIDHGAHMIEFDVQISRDGDLMVIHDEKVDRTTDGKGEIFKMPTAAVQELSAGSWFDARYDAERVPTLDEALDLMRGNVVPMIEVKVKKKRAAGAAGLATEALKRHGMERSGVVICRSLTQVRDVRAASKKTPIAYLAITKRQAKSALRVEGVTGVDIYWKSMSLSLVQHIRQTNGFITPWTVNKARDIDRLLLLGCEAIISDSPVTLRDRIEGFEFEQTWELVERFLRGEPDATDIDLELEAEAEAESPDEVARLEQSDSDADWPDEE